MTRPYDLSVVLSAYHNRMMCSFSELRELLNYMTGHDVALWEIPRARLLAARSLARQHPWLGQIKVPIEMKIDSGHSGQFVRHVARTLGTRIIIVKPLSSSAFQPTSGVAAIAKLRARR